jgi:DNA polymerase/3'-5' exonuclease PolX
MNKKIAKILKEIAELLDIQGVAFKPKAYLKASQSLESLSENVSEIYKEKGLKGLQSIKGVGKSIGEKIAEYLKKGKIKYYEDLKKETRIRQIVTYYFETRGLNLDQLKKDARKRKIVYARYTRPAKQLLELAGSPEKAKKALDKIAKWAKSRNLDYTIETAIKKWLELDSLKPKEKTKKPYYLNDPMRWSEQKKKFFVINKYGEWLEFAGQSEDIEWREEK